jgi:hypothetical protein
MIERLIIFFCTKGIPADDGVRLALVRNVANSGGVIELVKCPRHKWAVMTDLYHVLETVHAYGVNNDRFRVLRLVHTQPYKMKMSMPK